jgi:hypothetical protein
MPLRCKLHEERRRLGYVEVPDRTLDILEIIMDRSTLDERTLAVRDKLV